MPKCNMDCFNCPYPDCINNEIESGKEMAMRHRSRNTSKTSKYLENRAEILAKAKSYYQRNKEARIAYQRAYNAEHYEQVKERSRVYQAEHRAERREYERKRYYEQKQAQFG